MEKKPKVSRKATVGEAVIPILFLIGVLAYSLVKLDADPHIPLILGAFVAAAMGLFKLGFTWKELEVKADVLLVSQTVTQKNIHIENLTNLVELLEGEGLRDKVVLICGGPRISHELAKELGYDAGFGPGKFAQDVASFAVVEMINRKMV